ncbi:MAG: hypothetical protein NVS2B9_05150 [Myxococcales bacterium]
MRALLLLSVLASGCAISAEGRFPAGHERITRREAVAIAMQVGVQHGYGRLRVAGVQREDDLWDVELHAAGPSRGAVVIQVDAWNGEVLRFIDEVGWESHHADDEGDDEPDDDD